MTGVMSTAADERPQRDCGSVTSTGASSPYRPCGTRGGPVAVTSAGVVSRLHGSASWMPMAVFTRLEAEVGEKP